jgi:hypothetical protein
VMMVWLSRRVLRCHWHTYKRFVIVIIKLPN